ncbi:uncharacterized protein LOC142235765 [Haematobia irritans]|uniref:uncharacterized protein LOC142235765 n=1 Tax=Haematobia irritans TaxID=7368 RepID=UPI003F50C8ED
MDSSIGQGEPHNLNVANQKASTILCQLCHESINGTVVCCRDCQKSYYENCSKASEPFNSWTCPPCTLRSSKSIRSSGSSRSSSISHISCNSKTALELKRLEEERELAAKRDQEYLAKKYKILEELEESPEIDRTIVGVNEMGVNLGKSAVDVLLTPNVEADMPNLTSMAAKAPECMPTTYPFMSAVAHSMVPLQANNTNNNNNSFDFIDPMFALPSTKRQNVHPSTQCSFRDSSNVQQTSFGLHNNKHHLVQPANPSCIKDSGNFQQTPLGSHNLPDTSQPHLEQPSTTQRRLTSDQLHARQTVPKELPTFSGSPEEWPLFNSTYEWSTAVCGLTDAENLIRLQRALRGEALEAVKRILVHPSCVSHAISILKVLYGQPDKILFALKSKIKSLSSVNPNKMESITNFAIHVKGLQSTIEACGLADELNDSSLLQELISKLPPYYQINWGAQKLILQQSGKNTVNVENNIHSSSSHNRKQRNEFLNTHGDEKKKKCHLYVRVGCNNIANCQKFLEYDRKVRWNTVKQFDLCKHCLRKHSGVCYNKNKSCNVVGCQYKHHHLLHGSKNSPHMHSEIGNEKRVDTKEINVNKEEETLNTHDVTKHPLLFKVIPICIHGNNNKVVHTFAFLDDGSSTSLIEEDILNQLDLKGETEQLCLKWTANVKRTESKSQRLKIRVSGQNKKPFSLDVRSVKQLLLPKQTMDYASLCQKFSYLKGLPIESYCAATPKILIGLNNANMTICNKVREGGVGKPIAIKTALGWTVFGPCGDAPHSPFSMHICECLESDSKIHQMVKLFYNVENLGINFVKQQANKEDEKSMNILKTFTHQRADGHYETSLLWRYDEVLFPDNYEMAKKRLVCLENKLLKNDDLLNTFVETLRNYLAKGFISKIDSTEKIQRVWYLPIFPVFNKNKPGKCRIVWDAAAKFNGVSLNSMLLKGPDFLCSLQGILYKFRERSVATCGDIEQMFHQVFIREEDRHVQRFLWRNCQTDVKPDVYIMNVMTFGASCSPCISQYIKNLNAAKFEEKLPQAASAFKENHYVDDFLYSTDTPEQAIQIAKETHFIQKQAGFNLRNWCSNVPAVIEQLEGQQAKSQKQLKILGVFWNPPMDKIVFKISPHILENDAVCGRKYATKSQVLKILMTIYDPLGLIGNFLMYLKIILQEIWKSGVEWDEPIKKEQNEKWVKWLQHLPELENVSIQRCYLKCITDYNNAEVELHTFVDASENGYAAVAYLRIVNGESVVCSLVGSKTRVAPLRVISIPRLELMAALIGTRFANTIVSNHSITINRKYFWSDSRTVLSWLTYNNKKYHQFVSLRVSEILETTELGEWNWITGKQNVADEATKWARKPDVSAESRWFKGPNFLLKPKSEWPLEKIELDPQDIERRETVLLHMDTAPIIEIDRFSKWKRLLRTTAYVLRFFNIVKEKQKNKELTSEELLKAESVLFRLAQLEFYSDEIHALKMNKRVSKTSSIYKVSPFLDECDILRVDGRLNATWISEDTRNPTILPRASRITILLVTDIHANFHHMNHETVVNEIRQKFYIPKLRAVLKRVVKNCQVCKIRKAAPTVPQMARLPAARLAAFCAPFTYTGLDYFGPIMVTVGRHTEKRYGALFTCLTMRAIHIEIVTTLNTSSCIIAIRNFMCRRGIPNEFYSDNGTNFVSAERELREAAKEVDKNELVRNFTTTTTKWNFNPPSSPHMGGAWERLVRSIKTVYNNITPTRVPNEELLRGMMAEVENIINSRPLVYEPIDNENAEAITPNQFLVGSTNGMKPLAMYDDSGVALRNNWLYSQQYAERFWRRWVKEYLPSLTFRSKWHEKAKPISVDDLVIVVDPSSPRNVWLRGKVIETSIAKDGQVRSAKILTANGVLVRPAARLAVLDVAKN